MATYTEIKRILKEIIGDQSNLPFIASVVSVEGESCTVEISDIKIPDVRLKTSINESANYVLITPKKNSLVTLLSLTGELDDLTVVKCDEIESISYKQDGLEILIDSTDGKVQVKNQQISLLNVFDKLTSVLTNLKVYTPSGPSTGVLPDSMTAINQFKLDYKKILK